ncbi:MAG TPA: hypothetical protein VK826_13640, partial [Bacteroidia bacterium]|nr:hypothetical protein [Bacteroidia bacterium]
MKKLLLAGSLLFVASTIAAQDYRAYVPQRPAYFHSNNTQSSWFYNETRGVAEDTSWVNGSHRMVKSYQEEIASGFGSQFSPCFEFDTSWVGVAIEQDTITWETWFFNFEGDTVKFDPSAGLGQSGLVCRMMNGNVMRGIVTSVTQGSIMAVTDSIRVITLNLEDQS